MRRVLMVIVLAGCPAKHPEPPMTPGPGDPATSGSTPGGASSGTPASPRGALNADKDLDGIPDNDDQCADHPEDRDGFEDSDGCPDEDNDQDGVLDRNDKCPNQPENKNGVADEDGCPD